MPWLLLLFVLVPAAELTLLVEVGGLIGTLNTFLLIIVTGILGAALAKQQGLSVLNRLRTDLTTGAWPGAAIADGAIILVAGALLLTPGIMTDVVGFLCLMPPVRRVIRGRLRRRFEAAVVVETTQATQHMHRHVDPGGPIIDVTPQESPHRGQPGRPVHHS